MVSYRCDATKNQLTEKVLCGSHYGWGENLKQELYVEQNRLGR